MSDSDEIAEILSRIDATHTEELRRYRSAVQYSQGKINTLRALGSGQSEIIAAQRVLEQQLLALKWGLEEVAREKARYIGNRERQKQGFAPIIELGLPAVGQGQDMANIQGSGAYIGSILRDPTDIKRTLQLVPKMMDARMVLTVPDTRGQVTIVMSEENMVVPIPIKLTAPIADSTATAASVSTQLNLLLAALRRTGQLPT